MKTFAILLILVGIFIIILIKVKKNKPNLTNNLKNPYYAKPILTKYEQQMYWRLKECFPRIINIISSSII